MNTHTKRKNTKDVIPSNLDTKKDNDSDDTGFCPIPLWYILDTCNLTTEVEVWDPIADVKPIEFVHCWIPNKIEGRHPSCVFHMYTNVFIHLNPRSNLYAVQSYIYWLNKTVTVTPMEVNELLQFVKFIYELTLTSGLWYKPVIKHIHFNPKCWLSANEKKIIGARLTRELKIEAEIEKAEDVPYSPSFVPTQDFIAKLSKMSFKNVVRLVEENYDSIGIAS